MYELPTSIDIDGEPFRIRDKGDFRMVLHCFEILNAEDLNDKEKIIAALMVFYEKFNSVDEVLGFKNAKVAVEQMFNFMRSGQEEPKKKSANLIDWDKDSVLITSAINHVAGKEIRAEEYIHWWTFIGYYMAIGDCALSQIVGIRYKIAHSEKLEKHEKKFMNENPQYFKIDMRSAEQKQADNYIDALWNGGNE